LSAASSADVATPQAVDMLLQKSATVSVVQRVRRGAARLKAVDVLHCGAAMAAGAARVSRGTGGRGAWA
jgi:hypothetical protein